MSLRYEYMLVFGKRDCFAATLSNARQDMNGFSGELNLNSENVSTI
jgi:hypothetical protein